MKSNAGIIKGLAELQDNMMFKPKVVKAALDIAWNDATSRDPFDAATEFQAVEQQLERVFAVTARMSRLTLLDFLR